VSDAAQKIIDQIPGIIDRKQKAGNKSAVIMNLKYGIDYKDDSKKETTGVFQSNWLMGAAQKIYKHCLKNGFNPQIEWWADERTNCGYALTINSDKPASKQYWQPSADEIMKALLRVLCDEQKSADALFIHGLPTTDDFHNNQALATAVTAYQNGMAKNIVINGLTAGECEKLNLAYQGCDVWLSKLRKLGLASKDLIILPPSPHTAAESENLLRLAQSYKWKSLTITSMPHHQLRCFLAIVEAMSKLGVFLKVYNKTFYTMNWAVEITKPVMGGGAIIGTVIKHVEEEFERIIRYAQPNGVGYTRHATIPEMFNYLAQRNR